MVETTTAAPAAQQAPVSEQQPVPQPKFGAVADDAFLNSLRKPTEGDYRKSQEQTQPAPETPKVIRDEKKEIELVSGLIVNGVDVIMQLACQTLAGETDPEPFKVKESQREQIREPLAKVMEYYKWTMRPEYLLILAIVIVYSPPVMKASGIRFTKRKVADAVRKKNAGIPATPAAPEPRGPGRPSNEEVALRKKLDAKEITQEQFDEEVKIIRLKKS